jgi:hypothetical protein
MNVIALRDDVVAEWAGKITAAWRETVEGVIEVGKLLIDARNALSNERGNWGRLIGDNGQQSKLPFGYRTAYRLIGIAADERILTHVSVLPPFWGTLHTLTKLALGGSPPIVGSARPHQGMGIHLQNHCLCVGEREREESWLALGNGLLDASQC